MSDSADALAYAMTNAMTDRDRVATDALLKLGYSLNVIRRMFAAVRPGAVLLTHEDIESWQHARHPPFQFADEALPARGAVYHAAPACDLALIEHIRRLVNDAPWVREYLGEWPDRPHR